LEFERFTCIGWRQTGGCSADGAREPDNDKDCSAMIAPGSSGFCECGGERKVKRPGCDKAQDSEDFSCRDLCAREPDFYEELDLDFSASEKDIKTAFRKLSLKYHPDKTRNNPALAPRFSAIREAYDVLSNSEHRAVYDLGGYRMLVEAQQGKLQKGPAMEGSMEVDLENFYNGWETQTSISRKVICRGCRDVRTTRCMQTCNAGCANELQNVNVQMGPFVVQQQQEVASKERCRIQATNLWVQIERGMAAGDTMNFPGTGEQKPKMMPGDVTLKFKQRPHKVFTRTGNDLKMEIEINLKEALLGFTRTIQHLDGHTVQLSVNGVTRPHEVMRIRKEGMPYRGDPTSFGDLYIKCVLKMPSYESLSDHHRQWLSQNLPD
jgi:DnaJ-class molecular chaperone